MIFLEGLTWLRNRKVNIVSTQTYSEDDMFAFLVEAAREIATEFAIPRVPVVGTLVNGIFSLANTVYSGVVKGEVTVGGLPLQPVSFQEIHMQRTVEGPVRYYHFDPSMVGNLEANTMPLYVGPIPPLNTSIVLKAAVAVHQKPLNRTSSSSTTVNQNTGIWENGLPSFHDMVLYAAAMKAFERGGAEPEKSEIMKARLETRKADLAKFLDMHSTETIEHTVQGVQ